MTARRYVTGGPGPERSNQPHSIADDLSWEAFRGVGDPDQRFSLWRLCPCEECDGTGKHTLFGITDASSPHPITQTERCSACRGEGRTRELIATAGSPEAVGVALVTLGREGEWADCPIGLLEDGAGKNGAGRWLVSPWERSPRNVSDAARLLRHQRDIESSEGRSAQ